MRTARAVLLILLVLAVGVVLVSGGSDADPRTPAGLPGLPPPFLGTAVSGDGGLTAAIDAYGDVVDLRAPGPAGAALIDNPSARQAAGTVPAATGIVPRVAAGGGPPLPLWRAESVRQGYLRGTNVVRTVARVGGTSVIVLSAAAGDSLAMKIRSRSGARGAAPAAISIDTEPGVECVQAERGGRLALLCRAGRSIPPALRSHSGPLFRECGRVIGAAVKAGRDWIGRSRDLGPGAPAWARSLYRRSELATQALTSRQTGAVAAGARDGWAYVWPRDAATAALALAASGHRAEARAIARYLTRLDLAGAARFTERGTPVGGRAAQGDALGWVVVAARAAGLPAPRGTFAWRERADYQESSPGTYLGNALAAAGARADAGAQAAPIAQAAAGARAAPGALAGAGARAGAGAQAAPRAQAAAGAGVDGPKTGHIGKFSARRQRGAAEVARIAREFGTPRGLVRIAGDPGSGLDSAAGWAVRPFGLAPLYRAAERTLLGLARRASPYGITPGEGWSGGEDPWTAPTASAAWALAALAAESRQAGVRAPQTNLTALRGGARPSRRSRHLRRTAIALLADLRRAATPAGDLPERVGVHSGIPTSTTPLLWSSALTVLALRELWPGTNL